MKTAMIAGATGLVGSKLLQLLLNSNEYQSVISIGRRKTQLENAKLEQHIVDFKNLNELGVKADSVFCCLGTTIKKAGSQEEFRKVDLEYPKKLADYSIKNGAKSFHLITAVGAEPRSRIFYSRVKGEVENEIIRLSFRQTHIYRPSLLLGKRSERRIMEVIGSSIMKYFRFLFIGPFEKYSAIEADRVAEYMFQSSLSSIEGLFIHSSGEMQ